MDYNDLTGGAVSDFFWFKGKRGLIDALLTRLGTGRNLKILNLGAGTGDDLTVIKRFGEVYVVDIEQKALDLIPQELVAEKKLCDACALCYPDGFFDMVVAFDVLEHIEKDTLAVSEIYRVLKPGGAFAFTVPAFNFLYSAHDRSVRHVRRYSKKNIMNLVSVFNRMRLGYWMCTLFLPAALQRVLKRNEKNSHFATLPGPINVVFHLILRMENLMIRLGIPLPFGLTIFGIYRK